jgi:23S rRNA pseudouridine2605 synthase
VDGVEQRIQKILAQAGISSRRKAEQLVAEGRVIVNGERATLGMKADPSRDHIKVDGRPITKREEKVYFLLNKPRGVVTSLSDPEGRTTIKDFLRGIRWRVFPVGRLDYDSEGLLLVSNDGDFAQAVLHPSAKISKTYHVKISGILDERARERLRRGVKLEDGATLPTKVKCLRCEEGSSWIEITIHEGRKRQIRRMLEAVGHHVVRLKRVAIGRLRLADLNPGEIRRLTGDELKLIGHEIGLNKPTAVKSGPSPVRRAGRQVPEDRDSN